MHPQGRTDQQIAAIASSAHGVVTRKELLEAGLSRTQIRERVRKGTLISQHPGVYRVGHCAPSVLARYMAAVKAGGPGAVLGGKAAAYLHQIIRGPAPPPEVITRTERRIKGVRTHRARQAPEAMTVRGIPVTTVPRTLVDLAGILDDDALARACHEAGVRYRTTPAQVNAVLGRRPGAVKLRAVMAGDIKVSLSKLERGLLQHLENEGLPLPITNRVASGRRVDCRWPDHHLTVELDGYRFHNSRHAWEQDRQREREARKRADEFRRYTYADVFEDPAFMLAELRELLV